MMTASLFWNLTNVYEARSKSSGNKLNWSTTGRAGSYGGENFGYKRDQQEVTVSRSAAQDPENMEQITSRFQPRVIIPECDN